MTVLLINQKGIKYKAVLFKKYAKVYNLKFIIVYIIWNRKFTQMCSIIPLAFDMEEQINMHWHQLWHIIRFLRTYLFIAFGLNITYTIKNVSLSTFVTLYLFV